MLEQPVNDIADQQQAFPTAQQHRPHVDAGRLPCSLIEKQVENFLGLNRSSPRSIVRGSHSVGQFASVSQNATETERQQARAGVVQVRKRRAELTLGTARP